jgi:hypothetical protein
MDVLFFVTVERAHAPFSLNLFFVLLLPKSFVPHVIKFVPTPGKFCFGASGSCHISAKREREREKKKGWCVFVEQRTMPRRFLIEKARL